MLESKFIEQPDRSPFVEGSKIPDFMRERILVRIEDEFLRYAAVINDPNTPVIGLEVITNEARAVAFFENLLIRFSISGRVVVKN